MKRPLVEMGQITRQDSEFVRGIPQATPLAAARALDRDRDSGVGESGCLGNTSEGRGIGIRQEGSL